MELIEAILIVTKCNNVKELRDLSKETKEHLAHLLEERVPSGLATIEEWNEVLFRLDGAPPEFESKKAKNKILNILKGEKYKELCQAAPANSVKM